jgi:outer membrane protein assembly factor BamB
VQYEHPAKKRSRLARWVILGGSLLSLLLFAAAGFVLYDRWARSEARLARRADEYYAQGTYPAAAADYEALVERFPDSDNSGRYRFRAALSRLRADTANAQDNEVEVAERFSAFLKEYRKDPLLPEHAADVGDSLVKFATEYSSAKVGSINSEEPLKVVAEIRKVLVDVRKIKSSGSGKDAKYSEAVAALDKVEQAVATWKERRRILRQLEQLRAKPSFDSIVKVEEILQSNAEAFPDLERSPDVKALVDGLFEDHLRSVKYDKVAAPRKFAGRGEEDEPAILFAPLIEGSPRKTRDQGIVLALARGVLYALEQSSGRARWARRVGIDITTLPVRVPARAGSRERILVLSSDTAMLTALDTDGNTLWRYRLSSPCLGRPVVVGQRAFLGTLDGTVHEIELIEGKLLGRYLLGQRLTLGGTREPGTNRVFFPADEGCVYVLDVAQQRCESILYSRHPAFTLRGEVILSGSEGDRPGGFLILTQSAGLNAVELRVFDLPVAGRDSRAQQLDKARLEGWTWFRPYHDPEKLIMVSDEAVLGLFGIRQKNNPRDQALFPLLPGGGLRLSPLLASAKPGPAGADESRRGRAEVAQLAGNDLWVLASNRLQRLRLAWDQDRGPRLVPAWPNGPLLVGSPLHASQTVEDSNGDTGLVVVTQPPRRADVWATCVDDESGEIRWRRQLGLVCQGEPIALAEPGKKPLLLIIDQGGALFALDPDKKPLLPVRLARGLPENPDQPPLVLPARDGQSAYVIATPGEGKELVVRHVKVVAGQRQLSVSQKRVPMPAPLGGTPAIVGKQLMLPLADETLAKLPLPVPQNGAVTPGLTWRADRAPSEARGHVLGLGGDRFLTTDGLRQVRVWKWPAGEDEWQALPATRGEGPTLELPDRIVAAPIRLPGKEGDPVRIILADAGGKLTLAELQADGGLEVKRNWALGGTITRGPFVQEVAGAVRIGCVVNSNRLVWLAAGKKAPLWSYPTPRGAAIIGRPQLAAGLIVLTDQAGRYVGLDPKTGKKAGPGYQLSGSVAPVSCPVAFHIDRLLAPLSDGTLLLLGVKRLKE